MAATIAKRLKNYAKIEIMLLTYFYSMHQLGNGLCRGDNESITFHLAANPLILDTFKEKMH